MNQPLAASVGADLECSFNVHKKTVFQAFSTSTRKIPTLSIYLPPEKGTPPLIVHYRVYPPPAPSPPTATSSVLSTAGVADCGWKQRTVYLPFFIQEKLHLKIR